MRLALAGMFSAKWTSDIHNEWTRSVLTQKPELKEKIGRTRELMDAHVMDCLVTGHHDIIPSLVLPDPDDRHVLAAAVICGADVILTQNLRDFPERTLAQYNIEAMHPDVFIHHLCELSISQVCSVVKQHRAALKNPPVSIEGYFATLERQGLAQTVAALRKYTGLL
jgi:predicted nucleic acid-binding protein